MFKEGYAFKLCPCFRVQPKANSHSIAFTTLKSWAVLCLVFSFSYNLDCCCGTLFLQFQQPLALQILYNLPHAVLDTLLITPDVNLGILRRLVRRADAGELWNLALSCLLVQAFGVTRFSNLEWQINKDLDKCQGGVGAGGHGV